MGSAVCFNDGYLKVTDVWRCTKLHVRDGLLKLKDFPKGFGGSGIELPEWSQVTRRPIP